MKLRNKKTGEITEAISIHDGFICVDWKGDSGIYSTLASLNKEFEDYKPAEPLIEDEKFRKAVRWWAVANDMPEVLYDKDKDCIYSPFPSDKTDTSISLSFDETYVFEKLEHRKSYTIAELCGEEE